jgi:hypothetical protein
MSLAQFADAYEGDELKDIRDNALDAPPKPTASHHAAVGTNATTVMEKAKRGPDANG